jgi:hypothetical protein
LYDPPPDERAYALEFDEIDFFRAYYLRLRRRLMSYPIVDETAYGNLYSLGIPGFQVGVHRDFENAAFEGAIERLYELSSAVESGHDSKADFQIFGDGIMVKMVEV